jgi:hypothetical protein
LSNVITGKYIALGKCKYFLLGTGSDSELQSVGRNTATRELLNSYTYLAIILLT